MSCSRSSAGQPGSVVSVGNRLAVQLEENTGRVSVPLSCGGVLVLSRVLSVAGHLAVRYRERRVFILPVEAINHGTLGMVGHAAE